MSSNEGLRRLFRANGVGAFVLIALCLFSTAATPINEIVAVVEGAPITTWDLTVEAKLRSLEQRGFIPPGPIAQADLEQSLEQLINRMVALGAADRFRVTPPSDAGIDAEVEELRGRAVGTLEEQLKSAGIPESRLRLRIRAKHVIRLLIDERIRDLVRVSDEEVENYMREHPSAETDAAGPVREYLTTVRLRERSLKFFEELRERATVEIVDPRFR